MQTGLQELRGPKYNLSRTEDPARLPQDKQLVEKTRHELCARYSPKSGPAGHVGTIPGSLMWEELLRLPDFQVSNSPFLLSLPNL